MLSKDQKRQAFREGFQAGMRGAPEPNINARRARAKREGLTPGQGDDWWMEWGAGHRAAGGNPFDSSEEPAARRAFERGRSDGAADRQMKDGGEADSDAYRTGWKVGRERGLRRWGRPITGAGLLLGGALGVGGILLGALISRLTK